MVSSMTPPASLQMKQYLARPRRRSVADPVSTQSRKGAANSPLMYTRPMWETSNIPTAVRTARTSERIPAYWTGMSHPPKGTIRAPIATWAGCSTVFSSIIFPSKGRSLRRQVGQLV